LKETFVLVPSGLGTRRSCSIEEVFEDLEKAPASTVTAPNHFVKGIVVVNVIARILMLVVLYIVLASTSKFRC
jgi:hypothetical protein